MFKSCYQLAVIIFSKTLKYRFPLAHAVVHLAIVGGNVVYVKKLRPFNYERFNLWSNILNMCIIWICVMGVMAIMDGPVVPILIMIFVGMGTLIGTGLLLQFKGRNTKYPGLLYFPKAHKIETLFRYQFGIAPEETKSQFTHQLSLLSVNEF